MKRPDMEVKALELLDYANAGNDSYCNACYWISNLYSEAVSGNLSENFISALETEITKQLNNFKEHATIVKEEVKTVNVIEYLEWNNK